MKGIKDGTGRRFAFLSDKDGAMMAWFALFVPLFIAIGALVLDISYGMTARHKLQASAEAAAVAGASQLPDQANAVNEALTYVTNNMPAAAYGTVSTNSNAADPDVVVGNWEPTSRIFTSIVDDPSLTTAEVNAVRVRTFLYNDDNHQNPIASFLGGIVGISDYSITTPAVGIQAPSGSQQQACIIALNGTDPRTFEVNGTPEIATSGSCSICVNSEDPNGFDINGNNTFRLGGGNVLLAADDWNEPSSGSIEFYGLDEQGQEVSIPLELAYETVVLDQQNINGETLCPDPFALDGGPRPFPRLWAKDCSTDALGLEGNDPAYAIDSGARTITFFPGLHCDDISTPGIVPGNYDSIFEPGIYHLKNANWTIHGNGDVTGNDVQFVLEGTTAFTLDRSGTVTLTAPIYCDGCGEAPDSAFNDFADNEWNDLGVTDEVGDPIVNPDRHQKTENGMLFYQDPNTPQGSVEHEIGGGEDMELSGMLYFSEQDVWIHGGNDLGAGSNDCLMLIAGTIRIDGNDTLNFDTSGCGALAPPATAVTLVERIAD